ncbi:MAG: hypothetical protein JNJ60_21235 [Rhodocyclaceae bacterium]|nr:hypothetical protein [Rhodocyclaceae bacterium]
MRKSLIAASVMGLLSLPSLPVLAEDAPASPHTLTGNLTIASDYRFRGITQTFKRPAIQGGVDYSHSSGLYLGNWNSNVAPETGFPGGNIEMDFYGGWKTTFGDFGLDVGFLYYYYPGSEARPLTGFNIKAGTSQNTGAVDNKELYIGGSWKWISVKYSWSIDDYFAVPETKNTGYLEVNGTYDLGNGWGLVGHIGRLNLKNFESAAGDDGKYTDWKLGVTKDVGSGWTVGAFYVDTNAKGGGTCANYETYHYCKAANGKEIDAGKSTVVVTVGKTF